MPLRTQPLGLPAAMTCDKPLVVQITDESAIESLVDEVIAANAKSVEDYKSGKKNAIGFLVGQVMKATGGKANPKLVNELLRKKIEG